MSEHPYSPTFEDLLIDRFMPEFHFAERHSTQVWAKPDEVFLSVLRLDLRRSMLVRALFALRSFPLIASGWRGGRLGFDLPGLLRAGFVILGREVEREVAFGLIGKFWKPSGEIVRIEPYEFEAFDAPGYTKAVWNFAIAPQKDDWSILSTETRIFCTDEAARKAFSRYWFAIKPFSGLIRTRALRIIKFDAES